MTFRDSPLPRHHRFPGTRLGLILGAVIVAVGLVAVAPPAHAEARGTPTAHTTDAPAESDFPMRTEIARFDPESGVKAGYASAIAGDYAVLVHQLHQSVQIAHLRDAAAGDWDTAMVGPDTEVRGFGSAIAIAADASRVYISATSTATVWVYLRSGTNDWELERIIAPDAPPERVSSYGTTFGESLALFGDRLVVGVPNATVDGLGNAGMAFSVDLTSDTWTPLIPSAPIANSITGQKVAVHGDRIAVAAIQARDSQRGKAGGVYLWDAQTYAEPLFTQQPRSDPKACLDASGGSRPTFGVALAFDEQALYVGSPLEVDYSGDSPDDPLTGCSDAAVAAGNTTQGAIYRFDDSLQQIGGKLMPPRGSYSFGGSIGVAGDALLVDAHQQPDAEGEVYVYDTRELETDGSGDELTRQWREPAQMLVASDPGAGAYFGNQVYGQGIAADEGRTLIGAPRARGERGTAYLFSPLIPSPAPTLTAEPLEFEYGQGGDILAAVTDVPSGGTVHASVAGTDLVPAPVLDGAATVGVPGTQFDAQQYTVMLDLMVDGAAEPAAHAEAALSVLPAPTTVTLRPVPLSSLVPDTLAGGERETSGGTSEPSRSRGNGLGFEGTVTAAHGTAASGTVAVWAGETRVGEFPVAPDGTFRGDADPDFVIPDGVTGYEARYSGDHNHLESRATAKVRAPDGGTTDPSTTDPGTTEPGTPVPGTGPSTEPGALARATDWGEPELAATGQGTRELWVVTALALLLTAGGFAVARAGARRPGGTSGR